jgi:hypothetical protein
VRRIKGVTRSLVAIVLALAVCATAGASLTQARQQPLVVVVKHGGLCMIGNDCRLVLRITDTTIWDGHRSRPLTPAARRSLVSAIHGLTASYLRTHPFKGTCPMAYDGQESIYRFRGFTPSIPSCRYDVRGIRAVRLTERLLAG